MQVVITQGNYWYQHFMDQKFVVTETFGHGQEGFTVIEGPQKDKFIFCSDCEVFDFDEVVDADYAYNPLDIQVGGDHYKNMVIQPVEFCHRNNLGFIESSIVKYLCRHHSKNGLQDLKKARHFLDLLMRFCYGWDGK